MRVIFQMVVISVYLAPGEHIHTRGENGTAGAL